MINLVMLAEEADILGNHLMASAPLEEGAFVLLRSGGGTSGNRLVATELILPPAGGWEIQERDLLRPSGQWLSAVIGRAIEAQAGLLFIHSHPDSRFPPGLSPLDYKTFEGMARPFAPMLDGPFAAAVVHPRGWAGVVWDGEAISPIDSISSVGRTLNLLSPLPELGHDLMDIRQKDALGDVHDRLRNLTVGVVGCGGLGSPIAEQLVRMGVHEVILVDDDLLDTPSNVRRVFGSSARQLDAMRPLAKVDVVGDHLESLGLGVRIRRVKGDVRKEETFRTLLDADVVMAGTDTHSSRAVVNDFTSAYLLPVIDVGVRAGAKASGQLCSLPAEVRVLTPTTPCLWCRKSIDGGVIHDELLAPDEQAERRREGYLAGGVGDPAPSVVALTVLGAGLATCALLSLLSDEGNVAPSGFVVDGFFGLGDEVLPSEPNALCRCRQLLGKADQATPPFIG